MSARGGRPPRRNDSRRLAPAAPESRAATATGRLTACYTAALLTPLMRRAIFSVHHYGQTRMAAILLLSPLLTELRGAGASGTVWEKLQRLDDAALGALLSAISDDGRRVRGLQLADARARSTGASSRTSRISCVGHPWAILPHARRTFTDVGGLGGREPLPLKRHDLREKRLARGTGVAGFEPATYGFGDRRSTS
jgi:hypothetical protein